jgi:hypothetical protein
MSWCRHRLGANYVHDKQEAVKSLRAIVASVAEQIFVTHELNWSWKAEEQMQSGLCSKTDVSVICKASREVKTAYE